MADDQLAQKRNTGPEPMKAKPNHNREKTYQAPKTPERVHDEKEKLPETTARDKVREEMTAATDAMRKRS